MCRVQVFLSPSLAVRGKGSEALAARHADMARILSRRHSRIDVVHALTLIPDEVRWQCTRQRVVSIAERWNTSGQAVLMPGSRPTSTCHMASCRWRHCVYICSPDIHLRRYPTVDTPLFNEQAMLY